MFDGTGRTAKQLATTPRNALLVVHDRDQARSLRGSLATVGRKDVIPIWPSKFSDRFYFIGFSVLPAVTVGYSTTLHPAQQAAIEEYKARRQLLQSVFRGTPEEYEREVDKVARAMRRNLR